MTKIYALVALAFWLLQAVPAMAGNGDADKGALIFRSKCMMCHMPDQNKVGPKLAGVVGRKAGTVAGYPYSPGLQGATFSWDAAHLDQWLAGPSAVVPGTKMTFKLDKPEDRANAIAYLKTLSAPN